MRLDRQKRDRQEIAPMPAIGSGLGGLDYTEVKLLIEKAFVNFPKIEVLLFISNL